MNVWTIAWKDLLTRLRDWRGLLLMLVAPLALAAILGAAFGGARSDGAPAGLSVALLLVDEDGGARAQALTAELAGQPAVALTISRAESLAAGRAAVEGGSAPALLHIPAGFSRALDQRAATAALSETARLQLYVDPSQPTSSQVVQLLVARAASQLSGAVLARQVAVEQIQRSGASPPPAEVERALAAQIDALGAAPAPEVEIRTATLEGDATVAVNPLAYFVPNMLIFFLMFSMFDNARSILVEEQEGTLRRMVAAPVRSAEILLGKLVGSFLTGLAQVAVLVGAASLIFQLSWGPSPAALALIMVASVAAITSLGAALAALARTSQQAEIIGGLITLLSGALSGTFVAVDRLPGWIQRLSAFTINYWSLQGLYDLTVRQQGLDAIVGESEVLFGIALVLFALAAWRLRRRIVR